jgi:hypothetical protein
MRNALLAMTTTMMLWATGCHPAPCGGCADYESCDVAANQCVLNTGARFDLVADRGNVPGDNWDPFFGPPDPFLCLSIAGTAEQCSTPQSDDSSPKWGQTLLTDLDGDRLLTTPLGFRYEDSDIDSADSICSGAVTITRQYLHDGAFNINCSNGAWARVALQNVERGTPTVASTP